jgi:pimeloyl-ACP methyl ester carboxylesterase
MQTVATQISRRCRPIRASAAIVILAGALISAGAAALSVKTPEARSANTPRYTRSQLVNPTRTRWVRISYRSWTGEMRPAIVLLPRWYGPHRNPPIPLVIAPHGRGITHEVNAHRWGNLPGIGGFAVINPAGQGRRLQKFSWGAPGHIADLARMPSVATRALPWLRIDQSRIYAFGGSMGGQETLLLAARYPSLLAGAGAIDSLVDFPRQYRNFPTLGCSAACRRMWAGPIGFGLQRLARKEVGGTPQSVPGAYAARSPLTFAKPIATSCVPLQIWWSRTDRTVVDSSKQSGLLFRRVRKFNGRAPVEQYVGRWHHTDAFNPGTLLPLALARFGLMPPGFDHAPAPVKFIPAPPDACGPARVDGRWGVYVPAGE